MSKRLIFTPISRRINQSDRNHRFGCRNDLENLLIYDPDDVPDENRSVFDLLKKTRENQRVIKND